MCHFSHFSFALSCFHWQTNALRNVTSVVIEHISFFNDATKCRKTEKEREMTEIELFPFKSINSISYWACRASVYFWSIAFIFSDFAFQKVLKTNAWWLYNSFHNRLVTITDWWLSCVPHCVTLSISTACLPLRKRLRITVGNHIGAYSIEFVEFTVQYTSRIRTSEATKIKQITIITIITDDVAINFVVYEISTWTKTKYRLTRWLRSRHTLEYHHRNHVRIRRWNDIIVCTLVN